VYLRQFQAKKRKQDFVLTSFARTLERELAAERELANAMALVIAAQLEPMCKVACVLPPFRENGCSADLQDTAIEKLQAALARHAAARAIQP